MNTPNKSFCVAPWTTVHALPDGTTVPCCLWDFRLPTGNLKKNKIIEIAHSDKLNDLRRRMLAGETIPECVECNSRNTETEVEWTNLKTGYNSLFKSRIPELIEGTNPDGSLKEQFKLRLLNIRFSNLCNYGCRSCNQWLSSVIAQEQNLPFPTHINDTSPTTLDQVLEHIDHIEYINMAGGEPLLIDEHWIIMDELLQRGRTDVKIDLFTNASRLNYKSHNLINYASQFPNFTIYCSIDAMGERAELYRYGTNWQTVEGNLKKLFAAKLNINYSVTVGATNIWHIPDMHSWLLNNSLIDISNPSKFRLHSLARPAHISTKVLPKQAKEIVRDKVETYSDVLKSKKLYHNGWKFLVEYMMSEDHSHMLPKFVEHHAQLDAKRGSDTFSVFPELVEWCK